MVEMTLAQLLRAAAADVDKLNAEYKPVVRIVRELIGVIPNCNPYLEIWPPAFRIFNVVIPNLLNLPHALMGTGAPKDLIGLTMYVASREAGCMYCTAHHCSFAIRRGVPVEAVVDEHYDEVEAAVADVASAMAHVPAELTTELVELLNKQVEPQDVEWIVLAVALSGFLTKTMDTLGVELEHETVADVELLIGDRGWSPGKHQWLDHPPETEGGEIPVDDLGTVLRVLRRAPGALRLDRAWTKGVPGQLAPALMMLEDEVGYSFPILACLQHKRALRAVATAIRESLNPDTTTIGVPGKCMVMLVYAGVVGDQMLRSEAVLLSQTLAPDLDPATLAAVGAYGTSSDPDAAPPPGLNSVEAAAVQLAKAASPSPVAVNEITISTAANALAPEQIVEVVSWMAVLQMLHRLYVYFDAKIGIT